MKVLSHSYKFTTVVQPRSQILEGKYGSIDHYITRNVQNNKIKELESISNFKKFVQQTPIIRMTFQKALDSIPATIVQKVQENGNVKKRQGVLHNFNIDETLNILNSIAQTPPSFEDRDFVGVPFYAALIDLINTNQGQQLFTNQLVNQHLKNIFNDYGDMLKSPQSLMYLNDGPKGWLSAQARRRVNYNEYQCDLSKPHFGFTSWNDWFIREFRKNVRVADPDPNIVVHSSESYPLVNTPMPAWNVQSSDHFWLKDGRYSLFDMFEAEKMGVKQIVEQSFVGGCIYQAFLTPWLYHRWRAPISGVIEKKYQLDGTYFTINPGLDPSSPDKFVNSQSMHSMTSVRQIYIIKADNPKLGRLAVIEVGMSEVSGCRDGTKEQGSRVQKGQLMGWFQFGGSSYCLVFDRRANIKFCDTIYERVKHENNQINSTLQLVNSPLAYVL